jgi:hypothetical protein
MTRLTNDIRKSIAEKAMHSAFSAQADALTDRRAAFGLQVYTVAFGRIEKQLNDMPEGFFPTVNSIHARFQGQQDTFTFNGRPQSMCTVEAWVYPGREPVYRRVPYERYARYNSCAEVEMPFTDGHPLIAARETLNADCSKFKEELIKAYVKIEATLNSFNSIKALIKAWPEVEELLPPQPKKEIANLPATIFTDLNTLIGLPSPKEKPIEGDIEMSGAIAA